jgi:predicted HD phosphohydrolase
MVQPTYPARAASLDDALAILRVSGNAGGEQSEGKMTALDHQLQCADVLRTEFPDDLELQIAGLFHDIGHRLAPGRPERHGMLGGEFVRGLFGDRVSGLIELHVDAKRYLVSIEPSYREQLSSGSAQTLIAQGEAMTPDETVIFEARPHAADAVTLRRADENAKVPGRHVPSLEDWMPQIEAVLVVGR